MQQEDLGLFQVGQIMRELKVSRRVVDHTIEVLGLKPRKWRGAARLFDEKQIDEIRAKLERNSRVGGHDANRN